jgi:hypothetical protein
MRIMANSGSSKTGPRLKITVLAVCITVAALTQSLQYSRQISGQTRTLVGGDAPATTASLPPEGLIDDFDRSIQLRFLTAPSFGIRRIQPVGPISTHLDQFHPTTDLERDSVAAFESNGWDVGIYLSGRRVKLRPDTKGDEKYDITYRLFEPIPVTSGLKQSKLRDSKKLADEVKQAFVEFQKPGGANENEMRFESGRWSFVARPVRAVNQSCLQCHTDSVVTERLGNGKFAIRKRRIGDANGILMYAFAKRGE